MAERSVFFGVSQRKTGSFDTDRFDPSVNPIMLHFLKSILMFFYNRYGQELSDLKNSLLRRES